MKHDLLVRAVKFFNLIGMTVPFLCGWIGSYRQLIFGKKELQEEEIILVILFMILYLMFSRIYDAFHLSLQRISELVCSQMLAVFFTDGIMLLILHLFQKKELSVFPMVLCFLGQSAFSALWALVAHRWYFRTFPPLKTIIIYDRKEKMES